MLTRASREYCRGEQVEATEGSEILIHNSPPAKPAPFGEDLDLLRVAASPGQQGVLTRLRLEAFLRDHLPREDRRSRVSTATGLMILLKNLLISREPLYGIGEYWAHCDTLGIPGADPEGELPSLNDATASATRSRPPLFDADIPSAFTLAVVAHAVRRVRR